MAEFKTAYDQREVPLNLAVVGDCKVGDFVRVTPGTSTVVPYMEKSTVANANYIVAQSDMTLMPVGKTYPEYVEYAYSDKVAKTVDEVPTTLTAKVKHVALYQIIDRNDIVPATDGSDHA